MEDTSPLNTEENLAAQTPETPIEQKLSFKYLPFFNRRQPVFVLALIGIIMYCTSLRNEYALDDGIIIHQNGFVLKGIRGIGDILTKDAYYSFYKRMHATDQLQGGRYRPIPAISYAIEQELIGTYRSGYYMKVQDDNRNGKLDYEEITDYNGEKTYEYNDFVDFNNDQVAQPNECFNCWDLNRNFKNEWEEDINVDGIFNEVDCQVYGSSIRHFNNIWLFVLTGLLLYLLFSRHLFENNQDMAFLAGLIYMIHPVHSEVVANVKGRDEIFSVLFITLTFLQLFSYLKTKSNKHLLLGALSFFLALMSKEYAVMLFALVPLAIYIFSNEKIKTVPVVLSAIIFAIMAALLMVIDANLNPTPVPHLLMFIGGLFCFLAVGGLISINLFKQKNAGAFIISMMGVGMMYLVLRLNAVSMSPGVEDTEILNNPFLLASQEQEFATKMVALFKYFGLSLFPHPLICDYSYATFAYPELTDPRALMGIALYVTLLFAGIILSAKRHPMGFAILTYLLFILMVGNLFFKTGLLMLESYLFHATIGTAMGLGWLIVKSFDFLGNKSATPNRSLFAVLVLVILVLSGIKNWERNWDWKNDVTLFLKDVNNAPNSVLVLGNAGARWIDLADTKEITHTNVPGQDSTRYNDYNGTLKISNEEMIAGGYKSQREAALYKGIGYLQHAVELHPRYVNGFLNLGLANYKLGKDFETMLYWKLAERLYPNNPYLNNYYSVYSNNLKTRGAAAFERGALDTAVAEYTKCTIILPDDEDALYGLAGALYNQHKMNLAKKYFTRVLQINPNREEVKKILKTLP